MFTFVVPQTKYNLYTLWTYSNSLQSATEYMHLST